MKVELGEIPTDWSPAPEDTGNLMTSVSSATATSYTWALAATTSFASDYRYINSHTASTITINIAPGNCHCIQYLLLKQITNACTVTITSSYGTIRTKGNATTFSLAAGQDLELSAVYIASANVINLTYTIFG